MDDVHCTEIFRRAHKSIQLGNSESEYQVKVNNQCRNILETVVLFLVTLLLGIESN